MGKYGDGQAKVDDGGGRGSLQKLLKLLGKLFINGSSGKLHFVS